MSKYWNVLEVEETCMHKMNQVCEHVSSPLICSCTQLIISSSLKKIAFSNLLVATSAIVLESVWQWTRPARWCLYLAWSWCAVFLFELLFWIWVYKSCLLSHIPAVFVLTCMQTEEIEMHASTKIIVVTGFTTELHAGRQRVHFSILQPFLLTTYGNNRRLEDIVTICQR